MVIAPPLSLKTCRSAFQSRLNENAWADLTIFTDRCFLTFQVYLAGWSIIVFFAVLIIILIVIFFEKIQ